MPYASNAELPKGVRNALPAAAQTVYRKAYNSALKQYGGDEGRAAKVAWAAVKKAGWVKRGGKWGKVKESDRLAEAWGDLSSEEIRSAIRESLRKRVPVTDADNMIYVTELYEDHAIVGIGDGYVRYGFSVKNGKLTIDKEGTEVHQTWVTGAHPKTTAVVESQRRDLRESDDLREASVVPTEPNEHGVSEGSVIIKAGTNKTGRRHYTPQFLSSHVHLMEGALCNVDHPTRGDERERPEGSLMPLAATVSNVRWSETDKAVLGDIEYLETDAGRNMKGAFANPTVRETAGVSIRWPGRYRAQRKKIGEADVEVPYQLLGEHKFFVDFVTRPTAGGSVSEIREEDDDMPEIAEMTAEELREAAPDLVAEIEDAAVEAAGEEKPEDEDAKPEETEGKPEDQEAPDTPTESDRIADLERLVRVGDGREVVRKKLTEAGLPPAAAGLVEADFADVDPGDDQDAFGKSVDARIEAVKGLLTEAAKGRRVTGAIAESDRQEKFDLRKRIAEAHGVETEQPGKEE